LNKIKASAGRVGVTQSLTSVQTVVNAIGGPAGGGGCSGPTVSFDMLGVHQDFQPFQACTEPMATAALISRSFFTVVVVVLGTFGIVRALGSAFGFDFKMGGGRSE
jgi:hypothetical protein